MLLPNAVLLREGERQRGGEAGTERGKARERESEGERDRDKGCE